MLNGRKVIVRRIPYGAAIIDGENERHFMGRTRVMRQIGRMLDEAGEIEISYRIESEKPYKGVQDG